MAGLGPFDVLLQGGTLPLVLGLLPLQGRQVALDCALAGGSTLVVPPQLTLAQVELGLLSLEVSSGAGIVGVFGSTAGVGCQQSSLKPAHLPHQPWNKPRHSQHECHSVDAAMSACNQQILRLAYVCVQNT